MSCTNRTVCGLFKVKSNKLFIYRYPYYALSVLNKEVWWLTWLRYTIWIPLYPTGITCECK